METHEGNRLRRTKIVCTIGPSSASEEKLGQLIDAGMNVARLNFSHGTHDEHGEVIRLIRKHAKERGVAVAILQDLAGPKIRTGPVAEGVVHLDEGDLLRLTSRKVPGDKSEVSLTYPALPKEVSVGDLIYVSDGSLQLEAEHVDDETITARILFGGPLTSHKGINLPNTPIKAPILGNKDRADLLFGLSQDVDYVAVSFVRNPDDIREVRSFLKREVGNAAPVPLIAKIEKYEALDSFSEILANVEGIMVARGDLGVEIPVEQVPRRQKRIIEETNWAGKPVITATQMLKSMVEQPRPTRAEVSDVANAILDGSNGIMLSEETAAGRYPVESVKMMSKIARDIESIFPFDAWKHHFTDGGRLAPEEAVAKASCEMAEAIDAGAIITCTLSGSTTHLIAKYRPRRPIIAATPDPRTYQRLALVWGCIPLAINNRNVDDVAEETIALALKSKLLKKGDRVVITAGIPLDMPGTTNLIKVSVA